MMPAEGVWLHRTAYRAGVMVRWLFDHRISLVRLSVALVCLGLIAPAQARIPVEPPQTVQTNQPVLCVHTRLDGEVDDVALYRTLQMIREMGASSIVQLFYWAYLQPDENRYDWSHADRIIRMAQHQGLEVIARLGVVPSWARPNPNLQKTSLEYLTPERYDDFAAFAAAFAGRYRGVVQKIIPWNEPNLAFEWGYRQVTPAEYADFLRRVRTAVKAADPDVMILGGALAPTTERSATALDDIVFLRGVYEAGGGAYFDALAVHTYGFTLPPDDPPAPDRLNFRRFELLWEVMREYGDGEKPVYITETSWNDHPRWVHAVRPGLRVQYSLDALRWAVARWQTVQRLCFWFFRAPTLYRTHQDYYAFVTVEFRPRPIYDEVKRWARE